MARPAAEQLRELFRLPRPVGLVPCHHILVGNPAACGIEIIPARLHQPFHGIGVVDRHDGRTGLVVRRVQRYRKRDLKLFLCQCLYFISNSAR